MNAIDGPLQGLSRTQASFDRAAGRIAKSSLVSSNNPQDQVSLSDEMVAILKARADYEANLKSLETANEMTKKLLDAIR
jgi:flagellar basal body rod protein FlgC